MYYNIPVEVEKQSDGLWRARVPGIHGCWVDEPTLAGALKEIHEVFALFLDIYQEEGRPLPEGITTQEVLPLRLSVAVAPSEHTIERAQPKTPAKRSRTKAAVTP